MAQSSEITDDGALRHYRTEIPNTLIRGKKSSHLSVYAKWLYVYLKSVAGDTHECFQSTTRIAEGAGLSRMSISRAKRELVAAALILVIPGKNPNRDAEHIRIRDIWLTNMQEFAMCTHQVHQSTNEVHQEVVEKTEHSLLGVPGGYSGVPGGYSGVPGGYSGVPVVATKKIPLRRSPEEENYPSIIPPPKRATKKLLISPEARTVLAYLNTTLDRRYRDATGIQRLLGTGATVAECTLVIDWLHQVERVQNPVGFEKYADNVTPFRPLNFDRNREKARQWHDRKHSTHHTPPFKVAL
jgi:hypothetical protein